MRWLLRVFAAAVVRRLAYLALAFLLAWLGLASARAATFADQGAAYAACIEHAKASVSERGEYARNPKCDLSDVYGNPKPTTYYGWFEYTPNGSVWQRSDDGVYDFTGGTTCAQRPKEYGWVSNAQLNTVCERGCFYESTLDVSSGQRWYEASGGTCTNSDAPPPSKDSDGDGVPDDQDAFPNDPNESKDTDGDGIGDNADIAPNDPTNGDDKQDGDEKDNQAGGGGDCNAPPSCSGDAIACNTNWQLWRLRCTGTGTVTGDPTNCTASYSCSGDSMQCAQVALLRVQACKSSDGSGTEPGQGNGDGQPDWTKGGEPVRDADNGENEPSAVQRWGIPLSPSLLDREEIFGGGSCPVLPSFKIMGVTINPSDFTWWCTLVSVMRAAVLLMGAYTALMILMGKVV
ncbi:hypothetical protein EA658_06200 [Pseudoxanthomonas winnipegensis]|uniref:Uncharacterized protein n=1 Tax=Pseudoxanthomonas winnipegensis TaxID=2480810 RepID=A0ABY1WF34_9GAMM|nr:hypothetical protein [Pseudoxanthomonas winnipegensis]TAA20548.1 hypothetical protein EA658_06200 [Pseudoxanthomonas winnipegensis]